MKRGFIRSRIGLALGLMMILGRTAPAAGAAGQGAAPSLMYDDPWTLSAILELSTMADQLEACAAETGYYVALEALDDSSAPTPVHPWNFINNGGGSFAIRPSEGRFRMDRINFLGSYPTWGGPYLTYQDGRGQNGTTPYDQGSPLDPWGNPYYLFTPLGLARGDSGQITLELYGDAFDRYTLVSLGPDGVMSADDLGWAFGSGVSVFALTSVRGAGVQVNPTAPSFSVPTDTPLTLRGRNLGNAPADGKVFFNNIEVSAVTSWTNSEIHLTLPAALAGQTGAGQTGTLKAQRGTAVSNTLTLTVTVSLNAARDWALYE